MGVYHAILAPWYGMAYSGAVNLILSITEKSKFNLYRSGKESRIWNFQKWGQARIKNFKKLKNFSSQESRFCFKFSWFQARIKKGKTAILDFKRESRLEIREETKDSSKNWNDHFLFNFKGMHILAFFIIYEVYVTCKPCSRIWQ